MSDSKIADVSASQQSSWVDYYNDRFDKMKPVSDDEEDSKVEDLHVVSGWTDVPAEIWSRYVESCVDLLGVQNGGKELSLFEAGCGCLGFIEPIRKKFPGLSFGGMDGSDAFKKWIDPAKGYERAKFYQGMLPNGLRTGDDVEKYDFVVCNSVFQYLTHNEAEDTVRRMLQIVKPGGKVMVCDVCDEATMDVEEAFMKHHVPGYGKDRSHTYYAKKWWLQFGVKDTQFFHSKAKGYVRGKTRYQAVLTLPASRE
eukprot:g3498.t1